MSKHPVIHLLHDVGLAAWTGGSLMGAIGLNGAVSALDVPSERARAATVGWSRWAPVNAVAIAAHVAGATGLTITDRKRIRSQHGVAQSSAVKAALTGAGLGIAAWSAVLNRRMAAAGPVSVAGATEPGAATPDDVARIQHQLKVVQWLNPLAGMALLAATAVQEEQMRTAAQVQGRLRQALEHSRLPVAVAVAVAGLLAVRRTRARSESGWVEPTSAVTVVPAAHPAPLVEVDDGVEIVEVVDLTDGTSAVLPVSTSSPYPGDVTP